MAQPALAIGNDFTVSAAGVTKNIGSFRISTTTELVDFKPLDTLRHLRRITTKDCEIKVNGYESGVTGAGTFAMLQQLLLTEGAIDDIGWDDKSVSPVSMLAADFFDADNGFPLSEWRLTSLDGGPSGQSDAVMWDATFTCGHAA